MEAENVIFGIMWVVVGLILMAISIPLKNGKVAMNHFYGVRLKKSYSSEKNWYLMNTYGGKQLLNWSSVLVVLGAITFFIPFNGSEILIALFAFLPLIVLVFPICTIVRYSRTLSDS
jgi:uncharacterized membrane protein HdeD (DUF308 family)